MTVPVSARCRTRTTRLRGPSCDRPHTGRVPSDTVVDSFQVIGRCDAASVANAVVRRVDHNREEDHPPRARAAAGGGGAATRRAPDGTRGYPLLLTPTPTQRVF